MTTAPRPATGHPGHSEIFPCRPESAAAARRLVRTALVASGLEDLVEEGTLIASELVSNAVQHARAGSIRVVVDHPSPFWVCLGVEDLSTVRPRPRDADADDEGGRGLALVAELAEDWGTDTLPWGKRVWALLRSEERN